MKKYDILIREGLVIDPSENLHSVADVAIKDGIVVEVKKGLSPELSSRVMNAEGTVITPGLIDLHVHVFWGVSHFGIEPDPNCLEKGVTTVLDAGSSGADTFAGFRKYVIEVSATRIFAMLNISSMGMISPAVGELEDIRFADPNKAIAVCERNKDLIQGIKVRLSRQLVGNNGLEPLKRAKEAAEAVGRPIMVHIGDSPNPLPEILVEMRGGDILTHSFTGLPNGILGKDGNVIPEAKEAVRRGVIFDVGHGRGSFSFDIARSAISQGVVPGTISSDLHVYNVNGPVFDLATTASKFLHLGLPINEVFEKVTSIPARFLDMPSKIGTLREGAFGDIAVFKLEEGEFVLEDSYGNKETGTKMIKPLAVVKGGKVYFDRVGERKN